MSKIYTKTGDSGETSLVGGTRTRKSNLRIDVYGEIDELNSRLGFLLCVLDKKKFLDHFNFLIDIQSRLFDLGSQMACEHDKRASFNLPVIREELILNIESNIDYMNTTLHPLTNFILPGGSEMSARIHLCRTACRQVERKLITYIDESKEPAPDNSIQFLNRLSDYFFVLSRYVNYKTGIKEIIWEKN
jgi:cob(I)alamin adenosyltransferase